LNFFGKPCEKNVLSMYVVYFLDIEGIYVLNHRIKKHHSKFNLAHCFRHCTTKQFCFIFVVKEILIVNTCIFAIRCQRDFIRVFGLEFIEFIDLNI